MGHTTSMSSSTDDISESNSEGMIYFNGDSDTEGSWRTVVSADDLHFERLESSSWIPKGGFII